MIKDIGRKLENAKYRLSEVNTWISNFDSKASFLLAYVGILIGFLGTTGIPSVFYATFENSLQINKGFLIFCVVILYLSSVVALALLIMTLLARVKPMDKAKGSTIFFGDISKLKYKDFEELVLKEDEESLLKDITYQVYNNSLIAARKAKCYNYSVVLVVVATILFLLLTIGGIL